MDHQAINPPSPFFKETQDKKTDTQNAFGTTSPATEHPAFGVENSNLEGSRDGKHGGRDEKGGTNEGREGSRDFQADDLLRQLPFASCELSPPRVLRELATSPLGSIDHEGLFAAADTFSWVRPAHIGVRPPRPVGPRFRNDPTPLPLPAGQNIHDTSSARLRPLPKPPVRAR